jgi:hypothetical protein
MHEVKTDGKVVVFSHSPTVPILFLTNHSELGMIEKYCSAVRDKRESTFEPAVWTVWREGHNLVSADERLAALSGMLQWINHGTFITCRQQNVFLPYSERVREPFSTAPLGRAVLMGSELKAEVIRIKENQLGALHIDVQVYVGHVIPPSFSRLPSPKISTYRRYRTKQGCSGGSNGTAWHSTQPQLSSNSRCFYT